MCGLAGEACNPEGALAHLTAMRCVLGLRIEKRRESRRIQSRMSDLCQKFSFWVQQER